jgi:3',5'-cyclic AMP phosphodiesterase CpdA
MCDRRQPPGPALSRRQLLATAGAGAAAAVLAPAVPAWAQPSRAGRRMRLHVLSDTHVSDVFPATMQDVRASLEDLWSVGPDPDALVVVGDVTEYGHPQDYRLFGLTLQTSPHPHRVLYAIGNHEYHSGGTATAAEMRQRFLDFAGLDNVYHVTEVAGYPLVFIGSEGLAPGDTNNNAWAATLSDAQLNWLESTLASCARPDRPTLLFCHQPIENVVQSARLRQILAATPNLIYFWGHWHSDLNWLTQGPDPRLLSNQDGFWRVATGATTYLWQNTRQPNGATVSTFQGDWKQGLLVDVYDDGVVVRGRDFYRREWVAGFQATIPMGVTRQP